RPAASARRQLRPAGPGPAAEARVPPADHDGALDRVADVVRPTWSRTGDVAAGPVRLAPACRVDWVHTPIQGGIMIVVGYTGSSPSTPALEIASRLSRRIPSPLRIVHAFDLPTMDVPMGPGVDPPSQAEAEQWCSDVTTEAEQLAREFGATDVSSTVAVGPAPGALIDNATADDL